ELPLTNCIPNFFDNDSHDVRDIPFHSRSHTLVEAPPPVDKPPKKRLSKFLNKFTPKKKDRGAETQSRQEREQAIVGAEPKHAIDPQPAATPKDLTEKDKEKPKESTVDNTDRSSAPTAKAPSADSGHNTKQRARSQVKRIRQAMIRRERQEHAYIAEYRDRAIFACETGPLPDEIERGCCFHLASYICFSQRDPNINPRENNAQPITRLSQSGHGMAQTNSRSLRARLNRLLVWLHVCKRPPASATTTLSATTPSILSPNGGHNGLGALVPTPTPLSNQSPAIIGTATPMNLTEAPVHPSAPPSSTSQTPSSPARAVIYPTTVDPSINVDSGPASDMASNPWQLTDTERVDQVSVDQHSLQEVPDTQNPKDSEKVEKAEKGGSDTVLSRDVPVSRHLCAISSTSIAPIKGVANPSDQLYPSFFDSDSSDVPPPVRPLKKPLSKFLRKFTRKKKSRVADTQPQLEREPAIVGAEAEHAVDGKQKASKPDATMAEVTDRASTPTPDPQAAASACHRVLHS
ncbi:hypothetical protein PAXINDRAFT_19568, partial [Paxillus involutus ATCC 200175]